MLFQSGMECPAEPRDASFLADPVRPANFAAAAFPTRCCLRKNKVAGWRRRRLVSRITWASIILTLAAIGGGLWLAHCSPPTPQRLVSVAPVAPEMIYLRPGSGQLSSGKPASTFRQDQLDDPSGDRSRALVLEEAERATFLQHSTPALRIPIDGVTPPAARVLDVQTISLTLDEAAHLALVARSSAAVRDSGEPLLHDYQASQVAVVPEPSSKIVVALLAAFLISQQVILRQRVR